MFWGWTRMGVGVLGEAACYVYVTYRTYLYAYAYVPGYMRAEYVGG